VFPLRRKIPWRLSKFQKARQRRRLRAVDSVIATLDAALTKQGETLKSLDVWKQDMPTEAEMLPKDKYTMFDRKEKRYRKGIHSESYPFHTSVGRGDGIAGRKVMRWGGAVSGGCEDGGKLQHCAETRISILSGALADLIDNRATEVDESITKSQPAWLLRCRMGYW
jgi:hypothetical protein